MSSYKFVFFIVSQEDWLVGRALLRSENSTRKPDVVFLHSASSGVNRQENDVVLKQGGQHEKKDLIGKVTPDLHVLQVGLSVYNQHIWIWMNSLDRFVELLL